MAGRKKLPDAIKVQRGTDQPVRMSPRAPKLMVEMPTPPDWLSERATEAYYELAGSLVEMKVLSSADRTALVMLCESYATYRECLQKVREEGLTHDIYTANGTIIQKRPEVAIMNTAWKEVRAMLSEFGLTPSSRTKVTAIGENDEDPLEALKKRIGK